MGRSASRQTGNNTSVCCKSECPAETPELDAERPEMHSHAERGNERLIAVVPGAPTSKPGGGTHILPAPTWRSALLGQPQFSDFIVSFEDLLGRNHRAVLLIFAYASLGYRELQTLKLVINPGVIKMLLNSYLFFKNSSLNDADYLGKIGCKQKPSKDEQANRDRMNLANEKYKATMILRNKVVKKWIDNDQKVGDLHTKMGLAMVLIATCERKTWIVICERKNIKI